ncbi:hypothetical protein NSE01_19320 [Novosphingobium sediminis]|uniref:Uncharacterized protein n=1 Tax=Novosphingobium sediminis TaxID=707214 RepID=A0A512AK58_9SPHN|nr:hypothetical protein NSE01_19320 [Novosphingobium sediminis]
MDRLGRRWRWRQRAHGVRAAAARGKTKQDGENKQMTSIHGDGESPLRRVLSTHGKSVQPVVAPRCPARYGPR